MNSTSNPYVVVISAMPGSGKTTLGWEPSRRLHVPVLSRDDIKTGLHVTHRSDDPDEVWRLLLPKANAARSMSSTTTTR